MKNKNRNLLKGFYLSLLLLFTVSATAKASSNNSIYLVPASGHQTVTTCSGTLYDHAGTNDYSNNVDGSLTIYPCVPGSGIKLEFTSFDGDYYSQDFIYFYDGPDTSSHLIAAVAVNPGTVYASNPKGVLTVRFKTNSVYTNHGFSANISCVKHIEKTDLTVDAFTDLNTMGSGGTFTGIITVNNIGSTDAGPNIVGVYLSKNSKYEGSDILLNTYGFNSLAPGESARQEAYLTIPANTKPGEYYFIYRADINNQVKESDEKNNDYAVKISIVPLSIDLTVIPDPLINDSLSVGYNPFYTSSQLSLTGNAVIFANVAVFLSLDAIVDSTDYRLYYENNIYIEPNTTSPSGLYGVTIPNIPLGKYYVLYYVDIDHKFKETNEQNNIAIGGQLTLVPPGPDLSGYITGPGTMEQGQVKTVQYYISNSEVKAAGPSHTGIFLSVNNNYSHDDIPLTIQSFDSIPAGRTEGRSVNLVVPETTVPGNYYVIVVTDLYNQVAEVNESDNIFVSQTTITEALKPVIINGDFESPVDFNNPQNQNWQLQAWQPQNALATWSSTIGRSNSGGISLEAGSNLENDIAATQTIQVTPGKSYRLKGWIRTVNVQAGKGANLCIFNTWISSEGITGSTDWQQVSFDFTGPAEGVVTIGARLGYWSATSLGTAYFDDISIEEVPKFRLESDHFSLVLDLDDISGIQTATITNWLGKLDASYHAYTELMGAVPYNGEKITILSTANYPGGWAVAGNPILWYKPYINGELQTIQTYGNWSFGILHETGHDFVLGPNTNWIWNEEMFANLRMYYVLDKLNGTIYLNNTIYVGTQIKNYYKSFYDNYIGKGIPQNDDAVMYTLIRIEEQIGWNPFKKAYADLNNTDVNLSDNWAKFNLFLDKLTQYSGVNVRSTYPPGELNVIMHWLNHLSPPTAISAVLINEDTNQPVFQLETDTTLSLSSLPPRLNIQAITDPSVTGSVKFIYNGQNIIDNQYPYELFGDNNGDNPGTFSAGSHRLIVKAYSNSNATGATGDSLIIDFNVIASSARAGAGSINVNSSNTTTAICYPNPSSQNFSIHIETAEDGPVVIDIFNSAGTKIQELYTGQAYAGQPLNLEWNGSSAARGIYLLKIGTSQKTYFEKLILR